MKNEITNLLKIFRDKTAEELLKYFLTGFSNKPDSRIALASSLGAEDQVLTHMMVKILPEARFFILDTGRLHPETYELMERTMVRYNIHYEILFPDYSDIEDMVGKHGPNLFYKCIENRKLCCNIRKLKPLGRVLSTLDVWVTGLRRSQSTTRSEIEKIEWDEGNGLIKLNPLADWSEKEVWGYIKKHEIPYNRLHDRGFPSIGCEPCTKAIEPGDDIRAGRWWWESPEQKECGLHIVDGKLVRKRG
ncbi:MAG: phosphoadenylyl-sulfate reductase [Desulfatiglans sp.]|jgi:phosphoadenosine phosphosulfate reductase|nr:phosphoadenylyl-sulfate reductase [Desulfatiglans sp.]